MIITNHHLSLLMINDQKAFENLTSGIPKTTPRVPYFEHFFLNSKPCWHSKLAGLERHSTRNKYCSNNIVTESVHSNQRKMIANWLPERLINSEALLKTYGSPRGPLSGAPTGPTWRSPMAPRDPAGAPRPRWRGHQGERHP